MQGMRFLLLNEDGKPINHGLIAQKITPEKYLCSFTRNPPVSRVCDLTEIQGWNLFPTDDALNIFIESIAKDPDKAPPAGKKKRKKKAAKISSRSQSNGKP